MFETTDVAPFAGVWIEIRRPALLHPAIQESHPSRVCGLKYADNYILNCHNTSHPSRVCGLKLYMGRMLRRPLRVAPFAGVWIEILYYDVNAFATWGSHPSRVCGLKFAWMRRHPWAFPVAPFAGVWIEICRLRYQGKHGWSRTLRGCVD